MSIFKICPFYRGSENLGRGLGHCDLCGQATCEGDIQVCEEPDDLRRQLLERKKKEVLDNGGEEGQKKKPPTYRVLVVDDDRNVAGIVVAFLSRQGHQCGIAGDGIEALSKIHKDRFDAVVTDIAMPQMDGIVLTQEILSVFPDLPIMIMTGFSNKYSAEVVIAAGAQEFIWKPFSLGDFIPRFNKMMSDHEISLEIKSKQKEILVDLQKEFFRVYQREINKLQREIESKKQVPSTNASRSADKRLRP